MEHQNIHCICLFCLFVFFNIISKHREHWSILSLSVGWENDPEQCLNIVSFNPLTSCNLSKQCRP